MGNFGIISFVMFGGLGEEISAPVWENKCNRRWFTTRYPDSGERCREQKSALLYMMIWGKFMNYVCWSCRQGLGRGGLSGCTCAVN